MANDILGVQITPKPSIGTF